MPVPKDIGTKKPLTLKTNQNKRLIVMRHRQTQSDLFPLFSSSLLSVSNSSSSLLLAMAR